MPKPFLHIAKSLLIFLLFCSSAFAQSYPALKWQKFFGGAGDDAATCIDAGFGAIFVGGNVMEEGRENPCSDILVLKMTPEGRVLWERELGGTGCEEIRDLVVTPDSGVIFCGVTGSFIGHPEKGDDHYRGDMFIAKLNKRGEIDWMKNYGGLDLDQAWGIAKGGVNEYVIAGGSNSHNFDVQTDLPATNLFAVKLSHDGEKGQPGFMGEIVMIGLIPLPIARTGIMSWLVLPALKTLMVPIDVQMVMAGSCG